MSVNTTTRLAGPYVGNGAQTVFAYAFKIFATSDLVVTRLDLNSAETTLVLGVDYTATMNADQDAAPGGNVTLTAALALNYKLTITSEVPQLQSVVVTNGGGFFPTVFNGVFDRVTILAQQLAEKTGRALKFPKTSGLAGSELAVLANAVLRWKADGTGVYSQSFSSFCTDVGVQVDPSTYASAIATANAYADTKLAKASNLSDVANAATSRGNLGFVAGLNALWTAISAAAARTALGLGSAAVLDSGVAAGNVLTLDGGAKIPAVDGSQLTGLAGLSYPVVSKTVSYTHTSAENSSIYEFSGTLGTGVVLTVGPAVVQASKWFGVQNTGSAPFLITAASGTIDGKATIYVYPGERFLIRSDGALLQTIGRLKRVLVSGPITLAGTSTDFEAAAGDTEAVRWVFEIFGAAGGSANRLSLRAKKSAAYLTTSYTGKASDTDATPTVSITAPTTFWAVTTLIGAAVKLTGRVTVHNVQNGQVPHLEGRLDDAAASTTAALGCSGTHPTTATALQGIRFLDGAGGALTGGTVNFYIER